MAKDTGPSVRPRCAPVPGSLGRPETRALTPGSHRAEDALPPRPRPGCQSPSDLPARGRERGEGQSRHIPVRPAACPAAASIASTACGSAGLHRRRAPSLGRHPPGLRPPGPSHHACAAPPPRQSLRRRESHWARPRLRARPTLAPAVPRLRPVPLTLPLCPLTGVFSWREPFTPVSWLTLWIQVCSLTTTKPVSSGSRLTGVI